jgi:glycosyltransferase involved in cell wall biosynthesis
VLTTPGKAANKGFLGRRLHALRLRRLVKSMGRGQPFDLILSTLPFADEVVALARLPRVWFRIANTLSAEIQALAERNPRKAARRQNKYVRLYRSQNLVAVSDGVANDLRNRLGLVQANITRIYNPFDFAEIRQLADEPAPDLPSEPYVIHVGRFMPQKRHDLLFLAWKKAALAQKLVLLAHPGAELNELIAHHGLKREVIVAGFQANPYPWIKRAALLVLSSEHEGMPNVLVEALVCGTPVVSTDCPSGPAEILTGPLRPYLTPNGDAESLAAAMQRALTGYPAISDDLLREFAADHVVRQYEALPARWRAVAA